MIFVYFDKNGVIKETINDNKTRVGNSHSDRIYFYFEDELTFDDVFITLERPNGTLSTEISIKNNIEELTIPYDKKRDLKYFENYKNYKFYFYELTSEDTKDKGLCLATIRTLINDKIYAQGLVTFNVQNNVIKVDHNITQSQYDYLLKISQKAVKGDKGDKGDTGPQGPQGEPGKNGTSVTILGGYDTYDEFIAEHPTGVVGESYLVNGDLYVWSLNEKNWKNVGKIKGEDGYTPELEIGEDGYWYIDGVKQEVKAKAENGKDGKDGVDGQDGKDGVNGITPQLRINTSTNNWEVSYNEGGTWKSLDVKATGPKGDKGDDGKGTGIEGITENSLDGKVIKNETITLDKLSSEITEKLGVQSSEDKDKLIVVEPTLTATSGNVYELKENEYRIYINYNGFNFMRNKIALKYKTTDGTETIKTLTDDFDDFTGYAPLKIRENYPGYVDVRFKIIEKEGSNIKICKLILKSQPSKFIPDGEEKIIEVETAVPKEKIYLDVERTEFVYLIPKEKEEEQETLDKVENEGVKTANTIYGQLNLDSDFFLLEGIYEAVRKDKYGENVPTQLIVSKRDDIIYQYYEEKDDENSYFYVRKIQYNEEDDSYETISDWKKVQNPNTDQVFSNINFNIPTTSENDDTIKYIIYKICLGVGAECGTINDRYLFVTKKNEILGTKIPIITDLVTNKKYIGIGTGDGYKFTIMPSDYNDIIYEEIPEILNVTNIVDKQESFQFDYTSGLDYKEVTLNNWEKGKEYVVKVSNILGTKSPTNTIQIRSVRADGTFIVLNSTDERYGINLPILIPINTYELKAVFFGTNGSEYNSGSIQVGTIILMEGTDKEYALNKNIKLTREHLESTMPVVELTFNTFNQYKVKDIHNIVKEKGKQVSGIYQCILTARGTASFSCIIQSQSIPNNQYSINIFDYIKGRSYWGKATIDGDTDFYSLMSYQLDTITSDSRVVNLINSAIEPINARLDNLPVFEKEVASNSYKQEVPNNALDYALVEEIGGMSYESENLIVLEDVEETTLNGVTYSIKNGVIKISGTATNDIAIDLNPNMTLDSTKTYTIKLFESTTPTPNSMSLFNGTESKFFVVDTTGITTISNYGGTISRLRMRFLNGITYNGNIKPMLVKGSVVPTTFEQGYSGFYNAKVERVVFEQKNLIQLQEGTQSSTAYTAVIDKDGWITLNKPANSGDMWFTIAEHNELNIPKGKNYRARVVYADKNKQNIGGIAILYNNTQDTPQSRFFSLGYEAGREYMMPSTYAIADIGKIYIWGASSLKIENAKFKVELVENDFMNDSIEIPNENVSLKWLGVNADNGNYNCIRYNEEDGKYYYHQNIASYTFTGNETLYDTGTQGGTALRLGYAELMNVIARPINNTIKAVVKFEGLETLTANATFLKNNGVSVDTSNGYVHFFIDTIQTADEMKAYLTGKTLIYKLATPEVIDISSYMTDEYLQVQENGVVKFVNEKQKAVPNKITYAIKVV